MNLLVRQLERSKTKPNECLPLQLLGLSCPRGKRRLFESPPLQVHEPVHRTVG
jgi:hypothetical protein